MSTSICQNQWRTKTAAHSQNRLKALITRYEKRNISRLHVLIRPLAEANSQ
jgi:hypothetical protein